jgi:hypothetical protein
MAILLEDDVLVSTQFYGWLKFIGLQLFDERNNKFSDVYSISLYTPRVIETGQVRRKYIDYASEGVQQGSTFLYEVPCSWGSAFYGKRWSEALSYFEKRLAGVEVYDPIPKSRVNGWSGSWKKWLIEINHYEHWTTIYPYFHNQTSFSTNMLSKGHHIDSAPDKEALQMYRVPIFNGNEWYEQMTHKRIATSSRTVFDLHFKKKREKTLITMRSPVGFNP